MHCLIHQIVFLFNFSQSLPDTLLGLALSPLGHASPCNKGHPLSSASKLNNLMPRV